MAQLTEAQRGIVNPKIDHIKRHMPGVHQQIKAKADEIGNVAYTLVRRGLLGEPNCFYAFEGGHVVGTPFEMRLMTDLQVPEMMVKFGCAHVCIFGPDGSEGRNNGTH